jgi:hypothetical protein
MFPSYSKNPTSPLRQDLTSTDHHYRPDMLPWYALAGLEVSKSIVAFISFESVMIYSLEDFNEI